MLYIFAVKFLKLRAAGRLHTMHWRYKIMLLVIFLTSLLCVLGALTVTSAPIINRVFLPPFFPALLVLFASFVPLAFREVRVGALYVVLLAIPMAFVVTSKRTDAPYLERELGFLSQIEALGLTHGYSTDFWRSNVITLITAEEVTVRPLLFTEGLIEPRRWLTLRDWYIPTIDGRFFVLAPADHAFDFETLARFGIAHVETVHFGPRAIHVFDGHENLLTLPNWAGDDRVLQDHPLFSGTEVGVIGEGSDGVYLENASPGLLAEGPSKPLRRGEYDVDLRVACSDDAVASAELRSTETGIAFQIGPVCPVQAEGLRVSTDRDLFDAILRLVVEQGQVRYYGAALR